VEAMSKKQELIDRVLNDLDNNWVVSKQDILALIDFLTEAQVNRYWLFEDECYESANGAECITQCSDNIEDLKPQYRDSPNGWWHIFDAQEGLILKGDQYTDSSATTNDDELEEKRTNYIVSFSTGESHEYINFDLEDLVCALIAEFNVDKYITSIKEIK
jgi:hypothetical protein